jgi:hypothetical protein
MPAAGYCGDWREVMMVDHADSAWLTVGLLFVVGFGVLGWLVAREWQTAPGITQE